MLGFRPIPSDGSDCERGDTAWSAQKPLSASESNATATIQRRVDIRGARTIASSRVRLHDRQLDRASALENKWKVSTIDQRGFVR